VGRRLNNGPRGNGLRPFSKEVSEVGWMGKRWAYDDWTRVRDIHECQRKERVGQRKRLRRDKFHRGLTFVNFRKVGRSQR